MLRREVRLHCGRQNAQYLIVRCEVGPDRLLTRRNPHDRRGGSAWRLSSRRSGADDCDNRGGSPQPPDRAAGAPYFQQARFLVDDRESFAANQEAAEAAGNMLSISQAMAELQAPLSTLPARAAKI